MGTLFIILAFLAGLFIIWVVCKLLSIPLKILWKLLVNALLGALILFVVNLIGGIFGVTIPITPLNSLITGVLGIPGVILLLVFRWIL